MDVLIVVSLIGLGRGSEQRRRKLLALNQTLRKLDPVNSSRLLVLVPARACERKAKDEPRGTGGEGQDEKGQLDFSFLPLSVPFLPRSVATHQ